MLRDILLMAGGAVSTLVVLGLVFWPRKPRKSELAPTDAHASVIPFHDPKKRIPFESTRNAGGGGDAA